jgi:hypothetical protein
MQKSMLLAAAALTAGLLSASAQSNVYSVNIVGYVNTVIKGGSAYTLVANPLEGPTNDVNTLMAVLPNKSQVLVYDTTSSGYITATKGSGVWNTNLALPVGTGFFVRNAGPDLTNTFVGNVVGVPGTNTTALPAGYILVGSKTPIGGTLNDTGNNTLNLGGVLPNKSQVLTYDNSGSGSYITATKGSGVWNTNLQLNVGQGFFVRSQSATNWSIITTQ